MAAFRAGIFLGRFPQVSATFIIDQQIGLLDRGADIVNIPLSPNKEDTSLSDSRTQRIIDRTQYLVRETNNRRKPERWYQSFTQLNPFVCEPYDVFQIHFGNIYNSLSPFFDRARQPVMVSFHGHDASRWIRENGEDCYSGLFNRAQIITTPSHIMKSRLEQIGCPGSKIMVHRYGIDLSNFVPPVTRNLTGKKLRLVSVGRLVPKKGHLFAVEAVAALHNKVDCELVIIGEGEEEENLLALINYYGLNDRVHLLGAQPRSRIKEELSQADAFILPSITAIDGDEEGVPVSIIEAQAMGLPIVSTLHSGIPEIVSEGISGFLFPEKDIEGLAHGITTLANNPELRMRMGQAGRSIVNNEFNIQSLNDTLFAKLSELAATSQSKNYSCIVSNPATGRSKPPPPVSVEPIINPVHRAASSSLSPIEYAEYLNRMGEAAVAKGELEEAVTLFNQAINIDSHFVTAHNNVGVVLYELGKNWPAKKHLLYAHECDPADEYACYNLCQVLCSLGQGEEAYNIAKTFLAKKDHPPLRELLTKIENILHKHLTGFVDKKGPTVAQPQPTPVDLANLPLSERILARIPANLPQKEILKKNLARLSWEGKEKRYSPYFEYLEHLRVVEKPTVSIVIISWRHVPELNITLDRLAAERNLNYELIFVDNGSAANSFDSIRHHVDTWVRLNENTGAYLARNIGASFAHAPILMFLEDDGIPAPGIIEAHLKAHSTYDVYSVRGAVIPIEVDAIHEKIRDRWKHYHMGDMPFPACLNFEGNASYRSEMFYTVNGWDDDINFGHGGIELAVRILEKDPDRRKHMYSPEPLLYHNYVKSEELHQKKMEKQQKSLERLKEKHFGYDKIRSSWYQFNGRSDMLIRRGVSNALPYPRVAITWQDFAKKLNAAGWDNKIHRYSPLFDFAETTAKPETPMISVVMISWRFVKETVASLEILAKEKGVSYEVIFVNNGAKEEDFASVRPMVHTYMRLKEESGAYLPRNMGAVLARAPHILFLEDDGLPQPELLAKHLAAFASFEIDCCRGVYAFKTANKFNSLQSHYHLGNVPGPSFMGLEGNMSITREIFYQVGGWDDDIRFGGGGIDLSIRLLAIQPDFRRQMYSPDATILHDYCTDQAHLEKKKQAQTTSHARIRIKHPQLDFIVTVFNMFNGMPTLLIFKPHLQEQYQQMIRDQNNNAQQQVQ